MDPLSGDAAFFALGAVALGPAAVVERPGGTGAMLPDDRRPRVGGAEEVGLRRHQLPLGAARARSPGSGSSASRWRRAGSPASRSPAPRSPRGRWDAMGPRVPQPAGRLGRGTTQRNQRGTEKNRLTQRHHMLLGCKGARTLTALAASLVEKKRRLPNDAQRPRSAAHALRVSLGPVARDDAPVEPGDAPGERAAPSARRTLPSDPSARRTCSPAGNAAAVRGRYWYAARFPVSRPPTAGITTRE